MFFLSDEERRFVHRRLAPEARRQGVSEDLRGWNWDRPPLSPIFDTKLAAYEVASQYCGTGRDLYLRRVEGRRPGPSAAMVEGGYLHGLVSRIFLAAKRIVYRDGADCLEALEADLASPQLGEAALSPLTQEEREDLLWKAEALWQFEHRRILHKVQEAVNKHAHIGPDAIAALAMPVIVDQRLDGTFLGLSAHLAADAFATLDGIVMDVKFGPKEAFHRLSTTAYALVLESIYERPMDLGGVVYVTFRGRRIVVEREFHVIDDELRQWFIEARDERARLVEEQIDPGLPERCPSTCPFLDVCHAR